MRSKFNFHLVFLCVGGFMVCARAQGFLPPISPSTSTVAEAAPTGPLLIGDPVPKQCIVLDADGKKRPLLSYKAYLDILVVVFFSPSCQQKDSEWARFRRLDERFKDWRVAFVAVNVSGPETFNELATTLRKQKVTWHVAQDDQRAAASLFNLTGTPEVLIIDESGFLRYRGPIAAVPDALNTVISHTDSIKVPEPVMDKACPLL